MHMTKTSQSFPLNFCKTGAREGLGMRLAKNDNQLNLLFLALEQEIAVPYPGEMVMAVEKKTFLIIIVGFLYTRRPQQWC